MPKSEHRRKKKSKNSSRNQRNEYVYGTVEANDGKIELTYDFQKGGIEFSNLVEGSLHQKIIYERDSGKDKILLSAPCVDNIGRFETIENLKKNFDYIFAIDTNSAIINSRKISFAVIYYVPRNLKTYTNQFPFLPFLTIEINQASKEINPETIGWHLIINKIIESPTYSQKISIGLIVDSELGKLPEINNRKIPYYNENFLPANIRLVYASSDGGREYLPNMMISYCDKMGKKCLQYFKENNIEPNQRKNGDTNFFGYRTINFKKERNCA
jgi:hypothetical protein